MLPKIVLSKKATALSNTVLMISSIKDLSPKLFTEKELSYLRKRFADKAKDMVLMDRLGSFIFICRIEKQKPTPAKLEKWRRKGESLLPAIHEHKIEKLIIYDSGIFPKIVLAFAEGLMLGNYQFLKYRKDASDKESPLKTIELVSKEISKAEVEQLSVLGAAVYRCRSLVNEPLSSLNAEALAFEFEKMGLEAGIKVEILNKQKIEALRMGGLLAVNRGSIDPPTFTIMEYNPLNPVNDKTIVLVGKGVVYDTGGLSLKPNSSMDTMKCDMAGAATVAAAIYAIAKLQLPLHVVALLPATDNRPDGNAYVPGDIITMMDGTTVEVLNTDAEGRLLLADALSYAKNYNPKLVIDLATLTGAAQVAIGKFGMVGMHSGASKYMNELKDAGLKVHERIAEFPFWDEYSELIKSEIADLKNIGGPHAGAITAGKFLEHFTDYPWIHLDIAGIAFLDKKDGYRTAGGTAVGIRLLVEFVNRIVKSTR